MSDPNTNAAAPGETHERPGAGDPSRQQSPAAPKGSPQQTTAPQAHGGSMPAEAPATQSPRRLSTFLKVSIVLLAGLTVASISLLFIGDFEGKFERVFSTFALFAVFVLFTALDTRREQKSDWYAPVALIANAYILGLLLIVIWMTPYDSFGLMFEIFWKSVFVIITTRLVILCCQLLMRSGDQLPAAVSRFAFVTSVLAVLSGILFTAPVGIDAFELHIPDLYWKIATALLILTALGLSITLLLRWYYGSDRREAARAARQQTMQTYGGDPRYGQQQVLPAGPQPHAPQQGQSQTYPSQAQAPQAQAPQAQAPQAQAPQPQHPVSTQTQAPQTPSPSQAGQHPGQQAPLLPWPTYADGTPLPAGADGQPDFSVLQRPPHER